MPPLTGSYQAAKAFAGSYAALIKFRKIESVGSLGSMPVLAANYVTVEIADNAAQQLMTFSVNGCHSVLSGTGTGVLAGSTLQIPDIVLTTTHLSSAVFSATGSGASARWATTELRGPIGWKWMSPSDTTPTSASDPRVFDQDGDGHPGVTMNVLWNGTTTPVDFVETESETFQSGTVDAQGNLVGTTLDASVQNVIGGSVSGLTITTMPDPNTADNVVRLVRVASPLTCQDLMAQASTLFPAQ
jgi:hypothetical protein